MNQKAASDEAFKNFRKNRPAPASLIARIEASAGIKLPDAYKNFLNYSNGGEGPVGTSSYLVLWPVEELLEMNKAYNADEFAPGLLLFGSDGGDEAYAFDTRSESSPIVSVPFVGMDLSAARPIARTFDTFLESISESL